MSRVSFPEASSPFHQLGVTSEAGVRERFQKFQEHVYKLRADLVAQGVNDDEERKTKCWELRNLVLARHGGLLSRVYTGMVTLGKKIYMGHCASCHGRNLQGQPLWQLIDEYAGRRAPAHDETGHTWQHSDEDIFHMIKYGRFPSAPADVVS